MPSCFEVKLHFIFLLLCWPLSNHTYRGSVHDLRLVIENTHTHVVEMLFRDTVQLRFIKNECYGWHDMLSLGWIIPIRSNKVTCSFRFLFICYVSSKSDALEHKKTAKSTNRPTWYTFTLYQLRKRIQ